MRSIALVLILASPILVWAQTGSSGRTVLDGVFSAAQAQRGHAEYDMKCASCHEGADVDGPPLVGAPFLDRWREDAIDGLFIFIKERMPRGAAGTLSDAQTLDILAHILEKNEYKSGAQELTTSALTSIQLVGLDGPKPLPTNALGSTVGCFAAAPNNTFTLTSASEPTRARVADETNPDELKAAAARPLGTQTFRLTNLVETRPGFSPEPYRGKKVQAKGVVIRQSAGARINVLSLEAVASSCP